MLTWLAIAALVAIVAHKGSALPPAGQQGLGWLMPRLQAASAAFSVPLGVLVGWVSVESGGIIGGPEVKAMCAAGCGMDTEHCAGACAVDCCYQSPRTSDCSACNERGFFQVSSEEYAAIGGPAGQFTALSTNVDFSVHWGCELVTYYKRIVDGLAVDRPDTEFAWRLTKLCHTIGVGSVESWINKAESAGHIAGWTDFEVYVTGQQPSLAHWFGHVDEVFSIGAPYGVGV